MPVTSIAVFFMSYSVSTCAVHRISQCSQLLQQLAVQCWCGWIAGEGYDVGKDEHVVKEGSCHHFVARR